MPSFLLWMKRIGAVVWLLRPLNFVMFVLGVLLGGWMAARAAAFEAPVLLRLLVAACSAALIGGGANSLNDALDVEIDRINRPNRPLPAGVLAPSTAWVVWAVCSAGGLLAGFLLSGMHGVIATGSTGLLAAYSLRLKRTVLLGNLVVAVIVALAFVYGGLTAGSWTSTLAGAGFAFLTTLAREVVKDVEDLPGDARLGARTLPVVFGARPALGLAAGSILLTLALTPIPYLAFGYSGLFLLVVLGADGLLLAALSRLHAVPPSLRQASTLLKAAMLVGMGALATA
jgi:geranylgeranylglycerol-phosphate geranylgeranyltransferase